MGLQRAQKGADWESTLLERAISTSCIACARLWMHLGAAHLHGRRHAAAERSARTALRLGLTDSNVRRVMAVFVYKDVSMHVYIVAKPVHACMPCRKARACMHAC